MDLTAIRTELVDDPSGAGYAAYYEVGNDWMTAELLNVRLPTIQVAREPLSAVELLERLDAGEIAAAPAADLKRLTDLAATGAVGPQGRRILAGTLGPQSVAKVQALETRAGSRAEQLWGTGVMVRHQDVAEALACLECKRPYLNGHFRRCSRFRSEFDGQKDPLALRS